MIRDTKTSQVFFFMRFLLLNLTDTYNTYTGNIKFIVLYMIQQKEMEKPMYCGALRLRPFQQESVWLVVMAWKITKR